MISESEPWMPLNFTFQETCRVLITMDPVISSGVLIVGIGLGLSSQRYYQKPEVPGTVTCHCECGGERSVDTGTPFRDLFLAIIFGLVLGSTGVLAIKYWWSLVLSQPHTPSPSKGKGRKGVFGSTLALSIREG